MCIRDRNKFWKDGTIEILSRYIRPGNAIGDALVGICFDNPEQGDFDYAIGVAYGGGELKMCIRDSFIDEGFGSLDQETLDTAMKALGQLQQMGRTVGIISHVSELKSRIASQIVVGKDREGGSTVVFRSV